MRPRAHLKGRSPEQLSNGQVMVKLRMRPAPEARARPCNGQETACNGQETDRFRERPRARSKGRPPEQLSEGQEKDRPRERPRARSKGRPPEQLSDGQERSDPVRDPAPEARAGRRSRRVMDK